MQNQVSSQATTLADRVRNGNAWCSGAWAFACEAADDKDEWVRRMDNFEKGTRKLDRLCIELQGEGFEECLYDEPKCRGVKEIVCWTCPSKTAHWLEEPR